METSQDDMSLLISPVTYISATSPPASKWDHCILLPVKLFLPSLDFTKFLLRGIIHAVSELVVPIFFTGHLPDEASLALAGQFKFIAVLLTVFQLGIENSLYNYAGKNYKDDRWKSLGAFKLCVLVLFGIGSLLAIFILALTEQFVSFIDTPPEIAEKTTLFLWISSFSFPLILMNSPIWAFLLVTKSWLLVVAQIVDGIATFLLNLLLFGERDWSLGWGVNELGTYKVMHAGLILIINIIFLHSIEGMSLKQLWWEVPLPRKVFSLFSVSWGNFGELAILHFFNFMLILKLVNSLGTNEAGAWYLTVRLFYGVFLLPMTTATSLVNVLIGQSAESPNLKLMIRKTIQETFMCLTTWNFVLGTLGFFYWETLAAYFNPSNEAVQHLSTTMFHHIGFIHLVLSYANVLSGIFYGTGKTSYVFYKAVGTATVVYLVPWILTLAKVILPSYSLLIGMYVSAIVVNSILTIYFFHQFWNKIQSN